MFFVYYMKRELKPVKVTLTGGNINQLKKGNATLLKHAQLDEKAGTVTLYLRPRSVNKLHRAFIKNKGVKLQMVPEEFRQSFAGGFVDGAGMTGKQVLDQTKSTVDLINSENPINLAVNAIKKAVDVSKQVKANAAREHRKVSYKKDFKKTVGPVLKKVVSKAISSAVGAAAGAAADAVGQPELSPVASFIASNAVGKYADKGSDALGKATGGWGVGDVEIIRKQPASHGLNFIDPGSPAFHPAPGLKDNSDSRPVRVGGSFKPAGGYGLHPAMTPSRGHSDLRYMRL